MRARVLSFALAAGGSAQVAMTLAGVGGMPCPFMHLTGLPCPGCGVSRACAAMIRGQWRSSLRLHAFAALFLLAIILFAAATVAPRRFRDELVNQVERIERRTLLVNLLLALLVLYWLARLLYAPLAFARLLSTS